MRSAISFGAISTAALALAVACGGNESGSSGGSSGSGGSADGGGTGGSSGSGGSGGTSGSSGSGGSSGAAGGRCESDADCALFSDCCTCTAYAVDDGPPDSCPAACAVDSCGSLGVDEVECRFGQCALKGVDCTPGNVICESLPPQCPAGSIPSVRGDCWGPCVAATDCESVPSCGACGSDSFCVSHDAFVSTLYCVRPPEGCNELSCECLGDVACTGGFNLCGDELDDGALHCACPAC